MSNGMINPSSMLTALGIDLNASLVADSGPIGLPNSNSNLSVEKFANLVAEAGLPEAVTKPDSNQLVANEIETSQASKEAEAMNKKIEEAAEAFEAVFVSMLLKEMRSNGILEEGGGLFGGESSDTYGAIFDQFMGEHLAQSNPLGIADAFKQAVATNGLESLSVKA